MRRMRCPRPGDWPLLPLAVEKDFPLLLIDGYSLAGKAESPLTHIDRWGGMPRTNASSCGGRISRVPAV